MFGRDELLAFFAEIDKLLAEPANVLEITS
jgi:hypothetical protein